MSSYVYMSVDRVHALAQACVDRIDGYNKKKLAQAIAKYRRGWWIFKPSATLTDHEIEKRLRLEFKFVDSGGYCQSIARDLLKAIKHAEPGSMVQVAVDDLAWLT